VIHGDAESVTDHAEHVHEHTEHEEHEHHHEHGHEGLDPVAHAALHLTEYRAAKDEFMGSDPRAPLPHHAQHGFHGLSYYPHNPELTLVLPLDRDVSADPIVAQTSTGEEQEQKRLGKIHFEVDGTPVELTIFGGGDEDLFLPMRDATSGKETYGAGRYLEPLLLDENTVLVDFNYLFNPFCAYNEAYSCPLPPMENWLKVPIHAGEKTFEHAEAEPDHAGHTH
jgi:uncharacterized protein (DUF1684 family)